MTKVFNYAENVYTVTSPGGGSAETDWFKDKFKVYKDRAFRRRGVSYEEMVKKAKNSKTGVFSDEIRAKFGTIYTPEFVVEKTVDLAFKYLPAGVDPLTLTWCDPAAGDGNFLVHLFKRLMSCNSALGGTMDVRERVIHVLTKCLHGVEILREMLYACKIRLVIAGLEAIQQGGGNCQKLSHLIEELNLHHGNTIMLPEDVGQWEIGANEGGLLPEEIRNRKYDVIVGNPPYTHLRNLNNRRYHAYPKQRDMAQVFVRWALDHLTEKGVCSYNTTDKWFNTKLSDGAKETRESMADRIREIISNNNIASYSVNGGGDNTTFIFCFSNHKADDEFFLINQTKVNRNEIMKSQLLVTKTPLNFESVNIDQYISRLGTINVNKEDFWNDNIKLHNYGKFLCLQRQFMIKQFKITDNCDNIESKGAKGEVKIAEFTSKELAMFMVSYLYTDICWNTRQEWTTSKGGGALEINYNVFKNLRVPDFDYYKTNRPEQFNVYMKWIEENMRDKDKFLAGIDGQFGKLIK